MGIKHLGQFLRELTPNVFKPLHISNYAYKKIAVDTSIYIYKFKILYNVNWLTPFFNMIVSLRKHRVHPVFVYDNGTVSEKTKEKQLRSKKREDIALKAYTLSQSLDSYIATNQIDTILSDFISKRQPPRRLLSTSTIINIDYLRTEIDKLKSQCVKITDTDIQSSKQLLTHMQIPYCNAVLEAETTCVELYKKNLVSGILSEDTDLLAYGVDYVSSYDSKDGMCVHVDYKQILHDLKLTEDEFLDFCIMCSCDYNTNIPNIGPKNAYKLIEKFRTIDNVRELGKVDTSVLNHERIRDIFRKYAKSRIARIRYCGIKPNIDGIKQLGCNTSLLSQIPHCNVTIDSNNSNSD